MRKMDLFGFASLRTLRVYLKYSRDFPFGVKRDNDLAREKVAEKCCGPFRHYLLADGKMLWCFQDMKARDAFIYLYGGEARPAY